MPAPRPGFLVLCSGNSCRSQIAAAYLERFAGDRFQIYSAGTEPAEDIHPLTRAVLAEEGFDLSDRMPTHLRQYLGRVSVYYLAIVCDEAAKSCPSVWPGVMERLHWPFEDPATFEGTPDEKLARFREIRDRIKETVRSWADRLPAAAPASASD